jgi:hypothetical protein
MGKKYLETKNNSLESSVLGVWKTATGEGESIRDAAQMTKAESNKLPNMRDALMQIRAGKPVELDEGKMSEIDAMMQDGKSAEEIDLDEASGDKEAYKKFFDAALKKFKASSPADLDDDQKKKFFDYIDKNWEGDNEKAEAAMSQVREYKIQSMKAALAQVWGMEEGKNPFKAEDDDKEMKKNSKTDTGKKAAVIDVNPKIAD